MFRVLRMQLVTSRTILMGGDFNCTVELDGRTGSDSAGMDVTSRLLVEMTGEASLRDVVGSMGLNARNYSWSKPDGSMRSRIDFLFTSPTVKPRQELHGRRPLLGPQSSQFRVSGEPQSRIWRVEGHEGPLSLRWRMVGMGEGQVPELLPGCKQNCCTGKEEGFQAAAKQNKAPV
ncbi:hypothetical protein NDU88_007330 [Pleurodeles waltl]|uniref:Endonuclease/exonuclease/phosphatase domain-containing protein n=1 Tax=Pleurodeles waltl TaxID=8319 RepID=A0AAV7SSL0_PLEWA|nr:hypothetical protein NDU88_007330 [Pleurodeles waltl]